MKINISCPATGGQKCIEIEDEKKLRVFYDKRVAEEVNGDDIGPEYKGYIFRISGGNDKEGFAMVQGVLTNTRVRLLLADGQPNYRIRRDGERKRKSVRGCIVGPDIKVLNLVVLKKGEPEIAGVTDVNIPKRLGPKRANKIRKLFNLSKKDDVRQYVIKRTFTNPKGKKITKSPKIQRLITPERIQRKRQRIALKKKAVEKAKSDALTYQKLLTQRLNEAKAKRESEAQKRRSLRKSRESRESQQKAAAAAAATAAKADKPAPAAKAPAAKATEAKDSKKKAGKQ